MTGTLFGAGSEDYVLEQVPLDTPTPTAGPRSRQAGIEAARRRAATASLTPRPPIRQWTRRYVTMLVVGDVLSALTATSIGYSIRFGVLTGLPTRGDLVSLLLLSLVITAGWLFCLQLVGAYVLRQVSTGAREVQRVLRAALNLAGSSAIVAYFSHMLVARTFIAIVIPLGVVLQALTRYCVRRGVNQRRARGEWTSAILAVGTSESVRHLIDATRRNPSAGLVVIGACVEDVATAEEVAPGVPVLGDVAHAAALAEEVGADVVAVAGSGLGPRRIRELGWALEGTGRAMVMAPGLTEVAGPRVHVSPVEGLPLMWVDQPQFTGLARVAKRAVDVIGAGVMVLLVAPLLLVVWASVRVTSRGPGFYRSTRMGIHGREITVWKFRSMYSDAAERRAALLADNEVQGGVLFKMRQDPRVTPVGRFIRKFSIDELPQLLNVLGGSMSLVGPRPPLPDEVEKYHTDVRRRLLVKPGMTGLWQISGRSDLPWDEAVRLDLYYVENWSLGFDIAIVLRTVWAVLRSRGAY
ncbi:MAG TPA: sugar transferase [Jatrophihabitans sp.]|jgi:exopolysaccharide biosynthesis polyprenyl glycosylphosphotransferase|uniref:sugar transferase n=1 Tax=Jatrophihabitans sp. TaxID=1932789 RepID=UPI002DFDB001|nr:sugar transferase [Jatrophihabitans sp.]